MLQYFGMALESSLQNISRIDRSRFELFVPYKETMMNERVSEQWTKRLGNQTDMLSLCLLCCELSVFHEFVTLV